MTGKPFRQLCGPVLMLEAIVIGLAIPVAIAYEHLRHGVAGGVGGGLAVCALLLGGLVGRRGMGWALWAGTVLQVLVIASGIVLPAMYILGVIFGALWITSITLARRVQVQSALSARAPSALSSQTPSAPSAQTPSAPSTSRAPNAPSA